MLIELPNGRWVRLSDISSIDPIVNDERGPRVRVDVANLNFSIIRFDTDDDAAKWAREFAAKVNNAMLIDQVAKIQTNVGGTPNGR